MDSIYDPVPIEEDEVPTKKVRHRKKQFLKTIRKQMEFYFSDANLSKNRFLGQMVSKDPEVDLTVFLSFNKIRDLTSDLEDIKKALKKSDLLALTEDGTKIYRKTSVKQNEQAEESTIYVEQLPPDADHEWLKSVFLPYGDVPYVSIPKYPHNGLNKGFAFVEFDCPESATKALEAFGAMGCRLTAEIPPEQICSIKQNLCSRREDVADNNFKVPGEENVENKSNIETKKLCDSERDSMDEEGETKTKSVKKRKISFDDDCKPEAESGSPPNEGGRIEKTKVKQELDEERDSEQKSAENESETCTKKKKRKVEVTNLIEVKSEDTSKDEAIWKSPEAETKLSKKKKKKAREEKSQSHEQSPEEDDTDTVKVSKKRRKEIKEELQNSDDLVAETNPEEEDTDVSVVKVSKRCKKEIKKEQQETGDHVVETNPEEDDSGAVKVSRKRRKEIKEEQTNDQEEETEEPDNNDCKDDEKENNGIEEVGKRKKSRNHKKKSKKEKHEIEPKMNLRILSKFEWRRLRNKYLDLQKVKMTQLKQHLRRSRWGAGSQDSQQQTNPTPEETVPENAKPNGPEHKFTFTPGVIIHLRFPEPPDDLKKFKTEAKAHADVKYVDAREGMNEAFVRCATAEAANQLLAQQTWSEMDILTGVEETAYWEKMNQDREVQCTRNERVNRRGKTKLLAKVEKAAGKHIRFTTDEDTGPRVDRDRNIPLN